MSTKSQAAAATSPAKKILVLAGPGSGKTFTTVERIDRLIREGVNPREIIAMTFTNAGARELEARIARKAFEFHGQKETDTVPPPPRLGFTGTLHAFGLKMLKRHGTAYGYGAKLSIIGEETANELLLSVAARLFCKAPLEQLQRTRARLAPIIPRPTPEEIVVREFILKLREAGMVDFDLILSEFLRLLSVPEFQASFAREGFRYLFVDEYQDSAEIDTKIYDAMNIEHQFFVGDPDQAIYGFRGGHIDGILKMEKEHGVEVHRLMENFRSRSEICEAAQRLILRNQKRAAKETISTRGPGGKFYVMAQCDHAEEEEATLTGLIREELEEFETVAVLCRTNAVKARIKMILRSAGVPLYERAYVRKPQDWRLLIRFAELHANPNNPTLRFLWHKAKLGEKEANAIRLREASTGGLAADVRITTAGGFVNALTREGFSREARALVAERMGELDLDATIEELILVLTHEEEEEEKVEAGVHVITMHGSKGREFDVVFLPAFEEQMFPGRNAHQPDKLEEERRLAYVAITRAKEKCYITSAARRMTPWGKMEPASPSRFAREAL